MYKPVAVTTKITATSRVALKIKDNFYTVEFQEEREIPEIDGIDIESERRALFDAVNSIVDDQCEEILKSFRK